MSQDLIGESSTAIPSMLRAALQLHQAGQFDEAERIYQQILGLDPCHPDGLHLLGMVAVQTGRESVGKDRKSTV